MSKLGRWIKMFFGKSIDHVEQKKGRNYSLNSVSGYYNDLTLKVLKDKKHYFDETVFEYERNGKKCFPAIEVFQYGLGSYDLFLQNIDKDLMRKKFISYVKWALFNQNKDGSWDAFSSRFNDNIFSAMAQGEGASLLIRGFVLTGNTDYLVAAKKAIDFMLIPVEKGGTSKILNGNICLLEYTNKPFVFNGWIFASFGLFDLYQVTRENKYKELFDSTINCFLSIIKKMNNGYWSMYDGENIIASPFYHKLHIALLDVLHDITGEEPFLYYSHLFARYKRNPFYKIRSFIKKVFQKIKSKD